MQEFTPKSKKPMSSGERTASNELSENPELESTDESRLQGLPGAIARAANCAMGMAYIR